MSEQSPQPLPERFQRLRQWASRFSADFQQAAANGGLDPTGFGIPAWQQQLHPADRNGVTAGNYDLSRPADGVDPFADFKALGEVITFQQVIGAIDKGRNR